MEDPVANDVFIYDYDSIIGEVFDIDSVEDISESADKKRKETIRKAKVRTEKEIKKRLGWDSKM